MKVSVVVPSLNSGAYVREAVESALSQTGVDVEVLVQDGGSTDATLDVVRSIEDPRVRVVSEPDGGQADALNRAIARASGDWIVWLNADDAIAPGAFAAVAPLLESGDYDMVYGHFELLDTNSRVVKRYTSSELNQRRLLTRGLYIFSGTWIIRRDVYERLGAYDPEFGFTMDYEFLLRIAPHVRARHSQRVLARFREQPDSKTSTRMWDFFKESLDVRRRYGGFRPRIAVQTAIRQLLDGLYMATRPFWTSRLMRRALPRKRL